MKRARSLFAVSLALTVAPSCKDRSQQQPAPVTASAPPAPTPESSPPPIVPASTPPLVDGPPPEDPTDGCAVSLVHDVSVENISGWVALWRRLATDTPADPWEPDAGGPHTAAAVREHLNVKTCDPACIVTWPPSFPAKAAYIAVPLPNKTIDLYGPVLANDYAGQCSGQLGGTIESSHPLHANVTVETSLSTRVCRVDSGEVVPWSEGLEDCMSACVGRTWREVDFFLGASGRSAMIVRDGVQEQHDGVARIPRIQRKGDALIVHGVNGCTRWLDLTLTPRPMP